MGADGGIKIVEMSYVRENWEEIRFGLIEHYKNVIDESPEYNVEIWNDYLGRVLEFPEDISSLSNEEVGKFINGFAYCDWPCVHKDILILGYGDNIPEEHDIYHIFDEYISVETWT
jgi:hypothetical protein